MFRRDIFPYPREKDMPSTHWFCFTVLGDETNAMLSHRQHVPGSCLCLKIWLLHWIILTFSYTTQYIIFSPLWLPDCHSNELPSTPKPLKTAKRKSQATCGTTWIREDWIFCVLWALSEKSFPTLAAQKLWSDIGKVKDYQRRKHYGDYLKPNCHFVDETHTHTPGPGKEVTSWRENHSPTTCILVSSIYPDPISSLPAPYVLKL